MGPCGWLRPVIICRRFCGPVCKVPLRYLSSIVGGAIVIFGSALICFVAGVYLLFILPYAGCISKWTCAIEVLTGVSLAGMLSVSYYYSVVVSPGSPPLGSEVDAALEAGQFYERFSFDPNTRRCPKCTRVRVPETHHCNICQRCILDMDHHCPWMNQCVGAGNYRVFVLLLFWMVAAAGYALILYGPHAWNLARNRGLRGWKRPPPFRAVEDMILIATACAAALFVAGSILGGFHAYMLITRQTTIDFRAGRKTGARAGWERVTAGLPFPFWLVPWYCPEGVATGAAADGSLHRRARRRGDEDAVQLVRR